MNASTALQVAQSFDAQAPSTALRERWKYASLKRYAALIDTPAKSPEPPIQIDGTAAAPAPQLAVEFAKHLDFELYPLAALAAERGRGWEAHPVEQSAMLSMQWGGGLGFGALALPAGRQTTVSLKPQGTHAGVAALFITVPEHAELTLDCSALELSAERWLLVHVVLEASARATIRQYLCPRSKLRLETHLVMNGRGSEAQVLGAAFVGDQVEVDQQLVVEHRQPGARSEHRFHCAADGNGRSTFGGRIHIHEHASASVAELNNRNLALSARATLNTKPELEIYNDDVRCAHGATVGQLDRDALFYLRSRGVDEAAGRRLLTAGFLNAQLEGPLSEEARRAFAGALP